MGGRLRPRSRRVVVAALALALLAGAFAWLRRPAVVRRERGLNVLLVTIDTLRADALGCYGRSGADTPRVDRLAATGVRFDFAHAHNVVTLPSHANILSGRYPFDHGVRENSGFRFPAGMDSLATLLRKAGYHTGAFVSAFPLDSRFGLDRGFEVYDDRFGDAEAGSDFQMQERAGAKTVAAARAWILANPGPRFCWVHLYEPHAPYAPPFDWRGRVPTAYDGEVAAADAALAPLLDPLLDAGAADDTLVVLTADHGEGLGDHGEATHGVFAYESTLRVPLILHNPRLFAPRTTSEAARHVDILPTVLDALGLPVPEGLPGQSLLAVAQGLRETAASESYFESLTPALTRGWAPIHGVLRDRLKYVDLPIPELYDLGADPREQTNLVASQATSREQMQSLLARFRAAEGAKVRGHEDPEVRERLASLGYVGARREIRDHYGEADDPKRNIAFESALEAVIGRYVAGDLAGALSACEALVRDHPQVPLGLRHLSFLRRQAGNGPGAVEAGRRALAADPGSAEAAAELGHLLNDLGRPKETVVVLAPLARGSEPDLDVLLTYGIALAQTGQRDAAVATLQRARAADPSSALAAYDLGTIQVLFGDHEAARKEFEAAIQIDPEMARAYGSLGVLSAVSGKTEDAERLWNRALALNPRDLDTLLNLGTLLWRQGRRDDARPHLERFLATAPSARYAQDIAQVRALAGRAAVGPRYDRFSARVTPVHRLCRSPVVAAAFLMPAVGLAAARPAALVPFDEARPVLEAMATARPAGLAGLADDRLAAVWPGWVQKRDREVRERLVRGEADSVVNLLFFGTSFTAEPRLTPENLAGQQKEENDRVFKARVRDLVAALRRPGGGERLQLARSLLTGAGLRLADQAGPDDVTPWLLENVGRVRLELATYANDLARLRALPDATERFAARSTLFRDRGIALDTSLRPAFAIDEALRDALVRGLVAKGGVRRVAVVGPGLDFVDKAEGQDYYPPQSLQALALLDSLFRLGLARTDAVEVTAFDISPQVLDHLKRARQRAAAGEGYVLQLPRPGGSAWSEPFAAYWRRFGDAIGGQVPAVAPPKAAGPLEVRAVRVRPGVVGRVQPVDLNVVFQRLDLVPQERFDLVVATNILVYYDTFEQCLALANIGRMTAVGGLLLSNNILLELPSSAMKSMGYKTVVYSDRPDDGDHIVFYQRRP